MQNHVLLKIIEMKEFKNLSENECKLINGGATMGDFWYGVGYVAGEIANGWDAGIASLAEWFTYSREFE